MSSTTRQTELVLGDNGKVLLLSMRRLATLVASCILYEFEDVILELTGGDCVEVGNDEALQFSRRAYKLLRLASHSPRLARTLAPRPATVELKRDYDLFLPIFNHPHELYALATVPNWRERCKVAACFIDEVWAHLLPEYLLELLHQFDHVFIGTMHAAAEVGRIVGRPCTYLPLAANVLRFSPWPDPPARMIEVCNIGRRSAVTHQALMARARAEGIFYSYDTISSGSFDDKQRTFHVSNHRDHRFLLSQVLKRSRYYIANRARINEPQYTGNKEEIPGRYYEGAAAGAVLLGDAPRTPEFSRQFDWPDATIHMPFDCANVAEIMREFNRDPERLHAISRRNVHFSALRHDWLHRLQSVYETLGIAPSASMQQRETRLKLLADVTGDVRIAS